MAGYTHYLLTDNFCEHLHPCYTDVCIDLKILPDEPIMQQIYRQYTSASKMLSTLSDVHKKGCTKLLNNPYTLNQCTMP